MQAVSPAAFRGAFDQQNEQEAIQRDLEKKHGLSFFHTKRPWQMPQPTKAIISNEQKSGIRKGSNRASTGKVGALLLSVYI